MAYARRTDETQRDIVDVLQRLGFSVFSLASVGRGCPDLLLARQGQTFLAECKNGILGWRFTKAQRRFHAAWMADIVIFEDVESVLNWEKRLRVRHER